MYQTIRLKYVLKDMSENTYCKCEEYFARDTNREKQKAAEPAEVEK